jgi:cell division protein FtsB
MGGSGHGGNHGGNSNEYDNQNREIQQQNQQNQMTQQQPMMEQTNNSNLNDKCFDFSNLFNECMKLNFNNTNICSQPFEDLKKCQKSLI